MGSLGDRIGHKKLLLCGATVFGLVSAVTAYAPTAGTLIGMRALLGVAGATLMPATLALIRGLFPAAGTQHCDRDLGGLVLRRRRVRSGPRWPSARTLLVGIGLPDQRSGDGGPAGGGHRPVARAPECRSRAVGSAQRRTVDDRHARHRLRHQGRQRRTAHGHRRGGRPRRRRADAVHPTPVDLPNPLIDVRCWQPGILWRGGRQLLSVLGLSGLVFFLSQFFQLVEGYSPLKAGLAELPAAVAATVFGVLAGVRGASGRNARSHRRIGPRRHRDGVADLDHPVDRLPMAGGGPVHRRRRPGPCVHRRQRRHSRQRPQGTAGAAAAVSETAYELGMALGIATLGSIVIGVYRGFPVPPGVPPGAASAADDSLAAAIETPATLPANQADGLLTAAERVHHRSGHRLGRRLGACWPPRPRCGCCSSRRGRCPKRRPATGHTMMPALDSLP